MSNLDQQIRLANTTLLEQGKMEMVSELFDPGYRVHGTQHEYLGHAPIHRYIAQLRAAVGDLQVQVEVLLTGEERIAWQRYLSGIHRGTFHGFPATNRPLRWREMVVTRFSGQRIAEEWVISDLAEHLFAGRSSGRPSQSRSGTKSSRATKTGPNTSAD